MNNARKIAFVSVSKKDGIVQFCQELVTLGFDIIASGGTAMKLKEGGIPVVDFATKVGKAILNHRVVTLSRDLYAGLLANQSDPNQIKELADNLIDLIDMVCVDFYPMEAEIAKKGATIESVIEQTDIGGPSMARAAAKGMRILVARPEDREPVLKWLKAGMPDKRIELIQQGAAGEFVVTKYTLASARFRSGGKYDGILGELTARCKYGENAWQAPAHLYSAGTNDPLALDKFVLIEGTPPSYNNWVDIDRLLQTATHIAETYAVNEGIGTAIAVGGKHGNACGAAVGQDRAEVLKKMMAGDPLAIFGGLVLVNFEVDEALCESLTGKMLDGIIAPAFSTGAIAILRRKGDKCRFVANPALRGLNNNLDRSPRFRYVRGGFLIQPNYTFVPHLSGEMIKKYGTATPMQEDDMMLAWAIGSTSNSNTITLVKNKQLLGNGVGQQDRVGAAQLAITRARRSGHDVVGACAYSDSFFPFPDGPQILIDAGVAAIFTSSGSVKDQATIDVCAKHNVALYMVPDQVGRGFFGH